MRKHPQIISTEQVYRGKLFSVRRFRLKFGPDEVWREVVEHPGSVAIVATDEDGRFLLVSQFRVGVNESTIEIPAGTLEEGEEPHECAKRELEEETGYRPKELRLIGETFVSPGYSSERLYIFTAEAIPGGASRHEADENIVVVRLSREEMVSAIKDGKIRDLKSIAGLLIYLFVHRV